MSRRGAVSRQALTALCLALLIPVGQAALPAVGQPPGARAAELSSDSFVEMRTRLLGNLPEDPREAADALVRAVHGPDFATAHVAVIEILRQSGIATINVDAGVVAMPDRYLVQAGPMIAEYLTQLTRAVRAGDYYTINEVADFMLDTELTTEPIDPDDLLTSIVGWGKSGAPLRETVFAATAVRALGAIRGEPLFPGLDHAATRVDLLQLTLIYEHIGGAIVEIDEAQAHVAPPQSLFGAQAARAQVDCRAIYDAIQIKPPVTSGPQGTVTQTAFRDGFFLYLETKNEAGTKALKDRLRYLDIVSKGLNTIVFLTSVQLKVVPDKHQTHARHSGGDAGQDVRVVATAEWHQGETMQDLKCVQGILGINTRANGPMPGMRVKWSLEGEQTRARVAKFLRAKAGQADEFGPRGEETNAQGQSDVILEPPAERNPGAGSEAKASVNVYASLDKDSVPDALKAFLGNRTFLYDYLKDKATNWPKFLFDQLYDISLKAIEKAGLPTRRVPITVAYHGRDFFMVEGTVNPFLFYYTSRLKLQVYTCEGLDGRWQGVSTFRVDQTGFAGLAEGFFDVDFPDNADFEHDANATLNLREGRTDYLPIAAPFRLGITIDAAKVAKGGTGVVGTAEILIEENSVSPLLIFEPSAELPVVRHTPDTANGLDQFCPGNELYFP
jgi:hypothetical protein